MSITASGVGSGIDIRGLVDQLVAAEGTRPEQLLNEREFELSGQISAIGQLKSALATFQDSLDQLNDTANFIVYSGSSSDTDVASITTDDTAAQGTFNLVLDSNIDPTQQLATANKLITTGFADTDTTEVGTGNITIANANGDSFNLSFAGGGDNTLNAIRDAINTSTDNFGVTATILTVSDGGSGTESKLVLTANETGEDFALTITADAGISDLDSSNLTEITPGEDARFTIDGQVITSASNTVTNAISGVTIELQGEGSTTIAINQDLDAVVENVQNFISSYNDLKGVLNFNTDYNNGNPGPLFGDATTRNIESQIDSIIYNAIPSLSGSADSLVALGITSDENNGGLELDTDALKTLLEEDFDAASSVFTASDGIAVSLDNVLESYTQLSGLLDTKTDSLNTRIGLIDDSRERLEFRLGKLEARLTAQFIAMDQLVQSLNSTGSFLTQQLANLPGFTRES